MSAIDFSIIMTTRNRPEMFETALKSVLAQVDVVLEVVVVNDGSSHQFIEQYKRLEAKYKSNTHFIYLITSMNGHGQSYAINQGVLHAKGTYIAFLDDDDYWIDREYLSRALAAFNSEKEVFSIYCALQEAWLNDERISSPIWLEKNLGQLRSHSAKSEDCYYGKRINVLANGAFSQVNTVIIKRDYFLNIGGFDENIRYECDREFFLRAIDMTNDILFSDIYVSKHHVPDPGKTENMSTAIKLLTKLQFQLYLFTKLHLSAHTEDVRKVAHEGRGHALKHIASQLARGGLYRQAAGYASMALFSHFTFKWTGYYFYLVLRSLFSKGTR